MLTKKQEEVLKKVEKNGYSNLSRVEQKHIKSIKDKCIFIIENYDRAKKLLCKLVKKK